MCRYAASLSPFSAANSDLVHLTAARAESDRFHLYEALAGLRASCTLYCPCIGISLAHLVLNRYKAQNAQALPIHYDYTPIAHKSAG